MNQFIKVNNKILNKNYITRVVMDPDCTVDDGFLCSEITIFYVQGKEVLEEKIIINIKTCLDKCVKEKSEICNLSYDSEYVPTDLCGQCEYLENANKLAKNICKEKLEEQFNNIKEILGVDDIQEINCNGYISLNEEGKLCWKEK